MLSRKATILLSGGIDSAVCCDVMLSRSFEVAAVFVDFGQPARDAEWEAAQTVADHYKIAIRRITVRGVGAFKVGEIPVRNAFLASAAAMRIGKNPSVLVLGIHAGTPYYDCSADFAAKLGNLLHLSTDGRVELLAPLLLWSKTQIYAYAKKFAVPIRKTYSCELGIKPPCGTCLSCRDRKLLRR